MTSLSSELYRSIGVLLHPTSLPTSPGCGSFGKFARDWLKCLARNEIGVWQILPLSPTDSYGSPYSSPSGFALNPWFLDGEDLLDDGFIDLRSYEDLPVNDNSLNDSDADFLLADCRVEKLGHSLRNSWKAQDNERHEEFANWCNSNFWLDDHAVFMELRRQYNGIPWWEWPSEFATRNSEVLEIWRNKNTDKLLEHSLIQWHLHRQWTVIKNLAKDLGVLIFGDLPFYVARDSVDVWSNPHLFTIASDGTLEVQSGVPPDYFSTTGQLWGTPVYRWNMHKLTRFEWWRRRFIYQWDQVDLLRIDHFRALSSYWAVSGDETTAETGNWLPSPGEELLNLVKMDRNGSLPLIAEDLGVITPQVESLRDKFALPGMKVLQFAFDGNSDNSFLPENIIGEHWVVYTGTHDNPTTLGWWNQLDDSNRDQINSKIKNICDSPNWKLLEAGLVTDAFLVVVPIQDLLNLGNEARLNTPGTTGKNWKWRLSSLTPSIDKPLNSYGKLGEFYGRSLSSTKLS